MHSLKKESSSETKTSETGQDDILRYIRRATREFLKVGKSSELENKEKKPQNKPFWRIQPVSVEVFVREYMRSVEPSEEQWKIIKEVFPRIPEKDGTFFGVKEIILRVGQRGGKNTVLLIICNYAFYLWCCLEDPHEYFNLEKDEDFDVLIYSQVTQAQAKRVFYGRLSRVMLNTIDPETKYNWYSQNIGFRIREYGKKDIKEESMNIPHRNRMYGGISIYVLDTTAKAVEGYTIWIRITDEPSRANTPLLYAKAKHQYETAQTNLEQSFPPYFGLGMMFAYPEQQTNDLLMELYEKHARIKRMNSYEINNGILCAWYFTHVFNPKRTEADYEAAKLKKGADPIDIDRRWKAIVPPNKFGFFAPYMDKIDECANPELINPVKYKSVLTERIVTVKGKEQIRKFMAVELIEVENDNKIRYWGGDASETGDSFYIVGGYPIMLDKEPETLEIETYNNNGELEIEKIVINCKPVIDIIIRYIPSKQYPVDYVNVENNVVTLLQDHFKNSRGYSSDKYQSVSLNHKLLDIGIKGAEAIFPSNPVQVRRGRIVRHLVWNNLIEYLDDPILIREMRELLLINNSKLDHPPGGSKDVYDAVANCVCNIIEAGLTMNTLDIDGIMGGSDDTNMQKKLDAYKIGLKKFSQKYDRMYDDAREFCLFMREIGYRFTENDVTLCEMEMEYFDAEIKKAMPPIEDIHKGLDIG